MTDDNSSDSLVDQIHERVSGVLDDVDRDDVEAQVESFTEYSGVPDDEIERGVLSNIAAEHGIERDAFYNGGGGSSDGDDEYTIAELQDLRDELEESGEDKWISVEVTFDEEWDANHDSIAQTGLVGDDTGRTKITVWENSDCDELEEGVSYRIENATTNLYNGDVNISTTPNTTIEALDDSIEVNDDANTRVIEGAFVSIQSGSGLIERCPTDDCTRVLQNRVCSEHGKQSEVEDDLRIKATLDDGDHAYDVLFNAEMTEELTGIGMDDAFTIAEDALDKDAVADEMEGDLVGRYFRVEGPEIGNFLLVDEFEAVTDSPVDEERDLMAAANEVTF